MTPSSITPSGIFVDHFPCDPSAKNFDVHERIDEELRNCDVLWPNAPMGVLCPACSKASDEERRLLLVAAMERVEWHFSRPEEASEKWLVYLTCMLRMVSRNATGIDDGTLLRLARYGPRLHSRRAGAAHFHDLGPLVLKTVAGRKAPVTPELADALGSLADHLVRIHDHAPSTFELAFWLFRRGWSRIPWISIDMNAAGWNGLLNLADHNWQISTTVVAKDVRRIAAALRRIGEDRVASFIGRTVDAMEACQPTPMSGAGMTMLRQILRWVQARPELPVDGALYRLGGICWDAAVAETGLMKEWLGTFLATLAKRDRDRAFACVERLANNPDTKMFGEVGAMYDQYMNEMLRDVPIRRKFSVDGFPLQNDGDQIVESFLQASLPRTRLPGEIPIQPTFSARSPHVDAALRQSKGDYPAMLRAMNERVHWLVQHEPPMPQIGGLPMPWLAWRCDLGKLYCAILALKPELGALDLAALCRVDALGWLAVAPTASVFDACEAYIAKNGFDAGLTAAMQEWHKRVFGGGTAMALRKRIGWLLWFDTTAPVNEKACWSAIIRKDLRTMPAGMRGPWIALLSNVCVGIAQTPTKKWLKPAKKLLEQVGAQEFRTRLRAWFEPFHSGRELKITVAGRDILGSFLWYSQLAEDAQADEAVRWFATANWKAKVDRDRTARLLPIWIHTLRERSPEQAVDAIHAYQATGQLELRGTSLKLYEEVCRRYEREPQIAHPPPAAPPDLEAMKSKAMQKAIASIMGGAAQLAGDSMVVANPKTGESYEVGLRDGRIVRRSDGKPVRLEIDWNYPAFRPYKSMIDGRDLADPFGRNYFRAMFCARVLSGEMAVQVPIVEDES